VTHRPPGTILPFEMGARRDGGSYRLDDGEPVVDINTYTNTRGYKWALPLLAAGFGYYAKKCGAQTAYCLYDIERDYIKEKYEYIDFKLSKRFPEPISFSTFGLKTDKGLIPVYWR